MDSFNVHWEAQNGHKGKTCVTAFDKHDAKAVAENRMKVDNNNGFPFEGKVLKVIGPLGQQVQTPKRKLAMQYRSCIGAAAMARFNINHVPILELHQNDTKHWEKCVRAKALAVSQAAKLQRDIVDLFKLLGLKIKS